ncbi:hypothetical protein P8918_13015 [Bacillus spizizenii]|nr:hypothetical protein [Bacillus spizizenii]MCY8890491.1 hypothetical protein [Bacillus spizizenii]MEC0841946.1 hypothetical protein [Bacillus spizizenii]
MDEGLWEFIERKAREQENVDDSWMLTRLDTWKPMWSGAADYRLVNVVSQQYRDGRIERWGHLRDEEERQ